jgi:hypothetical protein
MIAVLSAAFLVALAFVVLMQKKQLAQLQALMVGATVAPGCVVAEAVALVLLAVAIVIAHLSGVV